MRLFLAAIAAALVLLAGPAVAQTLPSVGKDGSVNQPTLLGLVSSFPANPGRFGFYWQNQSAVGTCVGQIVLYHGQDTSGAYTVLLADGGAGDSRPGQDGSFAQLGIRHTGPIEIRVTGGTGGTCRMAAGES